MPPEIIALIAIAAALGALITFIIVRAIMFAPEKNKKDKPSPVFVNGEAATHALTEMIKCKTVSDRVKENEDEAEFEKFEKLLPKLFPAVFSKCEYEKVSDRAMLFRWRGASSDAPTVLMAHYDVVSVVNEDWEKGAFDGVIENGVLWGRGTIDTKGSLNGVLSAAEALISEGYVPSHDIYFAFGGDEEINGHGASDIVNLFKERGINPGLVLDEGGAVVEKVFPGVKSPCALIGIAEKGMLNVEYSVKGGGGHSSSPTKWGPVSRLSRACLRVEGKPFGFKLTKPALELFNTVGRHSTFLYRVIFANLWCFGPILNLYASLSGGEMNALVRTSTAFTQMEGSKGVNVIPPFAKMVSNHRIIPGESMESVLSEIKKNVNDDKVSVRIIDGMNPSRISSTECDAWQTVKEAVGETWQEAIVSPYLMLACSDSRHWGEISDKVYRFSPMALSKEERGTIHGNNERVPLATIAKTVEFYIRLMKKV
ncbi:MAG: M20/M25/M40 family metallo-hydrolase [Clostridia bacterium]|nr:M20/M25/M40 family metallo-hydrolase [Clostridia bacterium]